MGADDTDGFCEVLKCDQYNIIVKRSLSIRVIRSHPRNRGSDRISFIWPQHIFMQCGEIEEALPIGGRSIVRGGNEHSERASALIARLIQERRDLGDDLLHCFGAR